MYEDDYLSPAPHALPQAAGASAGLSAAPHALPHAAGASAGLSAAPHAAGFSAGFSDAPHAVPQAEAGASSAFLFHPNKLESAISMTSINVFSERSCPLYFLLYRFTRKKQARTFL
jgi:hypothetical protein